MANANVPSGLSPVKHISGSPFNGQANLYSIAASYTTALAIGDPVISSGTADSYGIPGITLAANTGALRGVIVALGTTRGLMANPDNLNITYRPGAAQSDVWYAMVVDDPNVIFEVQDRGSTPIAAADIGLNTNLVSGTNNGYVSGWTVDGSTKATTSTLQVRLLGASDRLDNTFGSAYQKLLVKINNHELNAGAAGV